MIHYYTFITLQLTLQQGLPLAVWVAAIGNHHASNGCSLLQCSTSYFGWIKNAHVQHIAVFACCSISRNCLYLPCLFQTTEASYLSYQRFGMALPVHTNELHTNVLHIIVTFDVFDRLNRTNEQRRRRYNTFFDTARVACNASSTRAFLFFHFDFETAPTLMTATPPASLQHVPAVFAVVIRWFRPCIIIA